MPSDYDASEFVDTGFGATSRSGSVSGSGHGREEVDRKVVEAQQKLVELKRAQESLEQERAGLEELRRRQNEWQKGREEVLQNLTRGCGLLEEAEFTARREAEQMIKALGDLRTALAKVQAIHEETWTKETFQVELTRALTAVENARMEWNSARLKLPVLVGETTATPVIMEKRAGGAPTTGLLDLKFWQLCKVGLALSWPLLVVALGGLVVFVLILLRK